MRITIDTQKDSREEIRKVVRMLSALVEGTSEQQRNIFDDPSPSPLGNLFDDSQPQTPNSEPAGGVFGNLFDAPAPAPTQTKKDDEDEDYRNAPPVAPYF